MEKRAFNPKINNYKTAHPRWYTEFKIVLHANGGEILHDSGLYYRFARLPMNERQMQQIESLGFERCGLETVHGVKWGFFVNSADKGNFEYAPPAEYRVHPKSAYCDYLDITQLCKQALKDVVGKLYDENFNKISRDSAMPIFFEWLAQQRAEANRFEILRLSIKLNAQQLAATINFIRQLMPDSPPVLLDGRKNGELVHEITQLAQTMDKHTMVATLNFLQSLLPNEKSTIAGSAEDIAKASAAVA
jgi:hypothetical protein